MLQDQVAVEPCVPGGTFLAVAGELRFVVPGGAESVCDPDEFGGGHDFPVFVPEDVNRFGPGLGSLNTQARRSVCRG